MTDATARKALAPCPFCGEPAELEHDSDHHGEWFNLGCSRHWGRVDPQCPAGRIWYTASLDEEADAIAAWNRRPSRAEPPAGELAEAVKWANDLIDAYTLDKPQNSDWERSSANHLRILIATAAERAGQERRAGAEAMREKAAKLCEDLMADKMQLAGAAMSDWADGEKPAVQRTAAGRVVDSKYAQANTCSQLAVAIRALPLEDET